MRSTNPDRKSGLLLALLVVGACADKEAVVPIHGAAPLEAFDGPVLFSDRAGATGLDFRHFSGATGAFLFPEILAAGVALLDYDDDGDLDVYFIQGNMLDPQKDPGEALFPRPAGQPAGNRLFRNDLQTGGALHFTDVTEAAGVGLATHGMGVAVADYDNDGDVDIYVTNFADNVLLQNNGDGTFSDVTEAANANVPSWSTSAAFLDYDRDGDLDLYVTAYVAWSLRTDQRCTSASGNRDYCGPQNYTSLQDHLLRNEGRGVFRDVSDETGIADVRGPGLGVVVADFDGDGWSDIFVANDGEANHVWINQEGRRFAEQGLMSGTAYNRDGSPEASMGVTAGDFDGDGDEDLFMTHLINETNTLYANDGHGAFSDVTDRAGLGFGSKGHTGFGSAWLDYDNDGWLDLFIANGDVKIEEFSSDDDYAFAQPNQLYRNLGDGRFTEVDAPAGDATGLGAISRGVAFGDIDNDGDTDFVVANNSGPARLLINNSGQSIPSLRLRLIGTGSNRDAYGARIAVFRAGRPPLWRRVHTDGSYLSASDGRVLVGLGDAPRVEFVGVLWPSGRREAFPAPELTGEWRLTEGSGTPWPVGDSP